MKILLLGLLGAILITSCQNSSSVSVYQTPKDNANPQTIPQPEHPTNSHFVWETPEDWQEQPPSAMRLASFLATVEQQKVDISLMSLSGGGGGMLANINRWLGQLDLNPIDEPQLNTMTEPLQAKFGEGVFIKLVNPEMADKAFLAAIFSAGQETLFVKATLPVAQLETFEDSFRSFCRSLDYHQH
jgi:hypothetical protein